MQHNCLSNAKGTFSKDDSRSMYNRSQKIHNTFKFLLSLHKKSQFKQVPHLSNKTQLGFQSESNELECLHRLKLVISDVADAAGDLEITTVQMLAVRLQRCNDLYSRTLKT